MPFLLLLLLSLPALAAGTEAAPFPIEPVPVFLRPEVLAVVLPLVFSTLASVLASVANSLLRGMKRKGKRASPVRLALGAALNAAALNFDQAGRQAKASNVAKAEEVKP